jgi:hypothetical protein
MGTPLKLATEEATPITDDLSRNWGEIASAMKDMAAYYGYEGEMPEHVIAALGDDKGATPVDHRKRVLQKLHIWLLVKWAKGEIPGPATAANLEIRAKKAESAAEWFKKMHQKESAAKQAAKAAEIRKTKPTAAADKRWW